MLNPAEIWQESGRWDIMGDDMFRLKDRFKRDFCLGMTHEEGMTAIARGELRSYKQLPQIWYQIQTKFRDEPRPKSGLLRAAAVHHEGLLFLRPGCRRAGCLLREALWRVLPDLRSLRLEVHELWRRIRGPWAAANRTSSWLHSDAGEDFIVRCKKCDYAANLEKAVSVPRLPGSRSRRRFHA